MCKKLFYLMLCVLFLGVTGSASADLIAHWPFDEGSGATLNDVVGGNNGTLQGDPTWILGPSSGALEFDGNEDLVTIPNSPELQLRNTGQYTVTVWVNVVNTSGGLILFSGRGCVAWANWYLGVTEGEPDAGNLGGPRKLEDNLVFGVRSGNGPAVASYVAAPFVPDTWMHVAATYDGTTLRLYIDGQEADSVDGAPLPYNQTNMPLNIAGDNGCSTIGRNWFTGKIDDFRIYYEALSQSEIQVIMTPTSAWQPNPADGGSVGSDPVLRWNPGSSAVTHNVYLGATMDDVSAATADNHPNVQVSLGQSESTYVPADPLEYGQTYYWRVDEVNGDTIWPGEVWSFMVQPLTAYIPAPVNEARYLDLDIVLVWNAGLGAQTHDVYLGTDPNNLMLKSTAQTTTTYESETLNYDTTYYWRVDEYDGTNTHVGNVWSFSTIPDIPISDPNLVGWWRLDAGSGTRAVDWSGYNRHGTIYGGPIWVYGFDGGAIEFDGVNNYVDLPIDSLITTMASCTISTWVNFPNAGGPWQRIFAFFNPDGFTDYMALTPRSDMEGPLTFAIVTDFTNPYPGTETDILEAPSTLTIGWHHVAVVINGTNLYMQLYLDGTVVAEGATGTLPTDLSNVTSNTLGRQIYGLEAYFTGLLDDFRIYDKALIQDEIKTVMRIDPLRAWNPVPPNGEVTDLKNALPLSWTPGDEAVQHDVYFGTDEAAVDAADVSDTTGIYRNRQDADSYMPPEGVEPDQVYYWRIDQINTDATVRKGRTWTFTVLPYLIVDNFESYNDINPDLPGSKRIYLIWEDGYANPNVNGSTIGYAEPDFANGEHFVDTEIIHGGKQSAPLFFDNSTAGYSEVTVSADELSIGRDWTIGNAETLSMWIYGDSANATTEQMYVKINNVKVTINPDLTRETWQEVTIDLAALNTNLNNVTVFSIGLERTGATGGSGMVFIDDIRLNLPLQQ
jgi:hypothetical protein